MNARTLSLFTLITCVLLLVGPFSALAFDSTESESGQETIRPLVREPAGNALRQLRLADKLQDRLTGKALASGVYPDVKANGSDWDIVIAEQDTLALMVALDPGPRSGQPAYWAILLETPWTWYYLDFSTWWQEGLEISYYGPVFPMPPTEVLRVSGLPVGSYTFYFLLIFNDVYYLDAVTINVTKTGGVDCDTLWLECSILCGFYPDSASCRQGCLGKYITCLNTGHWP